MTDDELNRIEARANAASKGPWNIKTNRHRETTGEAWGWIAGPREHWTWSNKYNHSKADADFIAHSREDIPALIAEVRQLKAERDVLVRALVASEYEECPGGMGECKHPPVDEFTPKICSTEECWLIWARNEVRKEKQT